MKLARISFQVILATTALVVTLALESTPNWALGINPYAKYLVMLTLSVGLLALFYIPTACYIAL